MRREEKRLARGWTYEPPTFYEQNEAAQRLAPLDGPQAVLCRPADLPGLVSAQTPAATRRCGRRGAPQPVAIV